MYLSRTLHSMVIASLALLLLVRPGSAQQAQAPTAPRPASPQPQAGQLPASTATESSTSGPLQGCTITRDPLQGMTISGRCLGRSFASVGSLGPQVSVGPGIPQAPPRAPCAMVDTPTAIQVSRCFINGTYIAKPVTIPKPTQAGVSPAQRQPSGVGSNTREALYAQEMARYRPAAEQGDARAQISLGALCEQMGDHAQALAWYRKATEQGDAHAQYFLGKMYELGRGVPKDETQAAAWYRKAAAQGFQHAQADLESMQGRRESKERAARASFNLVNGLIGAMQGEARKGEKCAQECGKSCEHSKASPDDCVRVCMLRCIDRHD